MNEFHNIDCLEYMATVPDKYFELAICDPPYGIDIDKWDKSIPDKEYFTELFRVSKNQIIWGGNYFNLYHSQGWICWDKTYRYNQKLDLSEFEMAWTSFDRKSKFLRFTYCGNFYGYKNNVKANYKKIKSFHPAQKPIEVYIWLLQNYAKPNDKIFDSHVGSGSSLIACIDEKFEYVGCELDKDYFDAASKRIETHKSQGVLF